MAGFVDFFGKNKTFRPKKKFQQGTLRYSLHKRAQASLDSAVDLQEAVKLPPGENLNDWLAVHVVDFFNRINLIYGTTQRINSKAQMLYLRFSSSFNYIQIVLFEYLWADGVQYKRPTPLPAHKYISLLMDWVESNINNEEIFPVTVDKPFPRSFVPTCKKILTRLFRVFVHVYIHHFDRIVSIGAEAHVNTCYKQFYYFIKEFDLVSERELEPLADMTRRICRENPQPYR
ncbi:MOB kinase activator-like 3 like protein [Argiope bruennichi]|uniref:MOB kinase activator-like 3 like protein n=1 Tax=Argiope bruennichi TaxID=94029 RepID=A0A8T0G3C1_ARGBR|nr:MOB kinase activator-like 3 like protein [Argiope bruennichi]